MKKVYEYLDSKGLKYTTKVWNEGTPDEEYSIILKNTTTKLAAISRACKNLTKKNISVCQRNVELSEFMGTLLFQTKNSCKA